MPKAADITAAFTAAAEVAESRGCKIQDKKPAVPAAPEAPNSYKIEGKKAARTFGKVADKGKKVYKVKWSPDSTYVIAARQDGLCQIYNAATEKVAGFCQSKFTFPMACAAAPDNGLLATGGMDNMVKIWKPSAFGDMKDDMKAELVGKENDFMDGYISDICFTSASTALIASGDGTVSLWDVGAKKMVTCFRGFEGDVSSIAWLPCAPGYFAAGSTDRTVRVYDIKSGECTRAFQAVGEVDYVAMFPNGEAVGTAEKNDSGKGGWSLFSIAGAANLGGGKMGGNSQKQAESVAFSPSGRSMYIGLDNANLVTVDTFNPTKWDASKIHEGAVHTMDMAPDGSALATGSFDGTVKLWSGSG